MAVVVETTIGDFTVDLYTDERPQTCRNFLKLCKTKFYNWNLFHTVQTNFIAQTGDPTGTGKGGESIYGVVLGEKARYYEMEQMPKIKHDRAGLLSMVNCGNNMLGSQFFITLAPDLHSLDGEHCVFGEIAEGLEVVLKFNETICDGEHRPYQDIRISHTVILEDPYEDPVGLTIPDRSPEPIKEALMSDRIGADESIDDTAGMTSEEIIEMQKEKEARARATILEIVGDIPDAEMAPPENVLFVCKLNPVTSDDDLEIIFSRFGKIVGCEVIRDRQTGDSLQYAFIEFADRKSCEDAYFKMDNVLIDDRRIHVDFSQSVAKMRWRGKGKGIKYLDERNQEEVKENRERRKKEYHQDPRKQRKEEIEERSQRDYGRHEEDAEMRRKQDRRKDGESGRKDRRRSSERNRTERRRDPLDEDPERRRKNRERSMDRVDARSRRDERTNRYEEEHRRPGKYEDRYSSQRKKHTRDRSGDRHQRRTEYKSKHRRN